MCCFIFDVMFVGCIFVFFYFYFVYVQYEWYLFINYFFYFVLIDERFILNNIICIEEVLFKFIFEQIVNMRRMVIYIFFRIVYVDLWLLSFLFDVEDVFDIILQVIGCY